ncbi:MAG: nicotinate phosphoribosyltransferase, partial [Pyrinomonadaceae bacterium]|nr:nicotinate phosphoribosyltransferase [Pyrinomonadaceae bacterium]
LAGVYKLAAIRRPGGEWEPKIKLSDQKLKTSLPGLLQVRRYRTLNGNVADCIYDERTDLAGGGIMINPLDQTKQMALPAEAEADDLLVPIMRGGELIYHLPTLEEIRHRRMVELGHVADATKRFDNPDTYRVGLEKSLYLLREHLVVDLRSASSDWEYETA